MTELQEKLLEEVRQMSSEELEAEAKKILERRKKWVDSRKGVELTEAQKAYRKSYNRKRSEKNKLIMAIAKERGLVK